MEGGRVMPTVILHSRRTKNVQMSGPEDKLDKKCTDIVTSELYKPRTVQASGIIVVS